MREEFFNLLSLIGTMAGVAMVLLANQWFFPERVEQKTRGKRGCRRK